MNENIDLTKILKDCPKGFELYSSVHGKLFYDGMYIDSSASRIYFRHSSSRSIVDGSPILITYLRDGKLYCGEGECTIFPSKEQRDWSKFTALWYKKERDAIACLETQGEDKKEINNNFDVLPGLYKCIHRMFDGTPDGRLLFEIDNVYKCLSKHNRAEFEVSYGHSVYLEDPIVHRYFIPFEGEQISSPKFNPNTLNAFDKVLVFDSDRPWTPLLFSYLEYSLNYPRMQCFDFAARKVIPYNDETKHLVGTTKEAPKYYRYWED